MTPPLNNKPDQIGDISLDFDTIITTASVTQKLLSKKKKKAICNTSHHRATLWALNKSLPSA